jgi:hypothetical protein
LIGGAGAVAVRHLATSDTVVLAPPGGRAPTRALPAATGDVTTVAGTVRAPDGSPLAGAEVIVPTPNSVADVYRPASPGVAATRSGADGRFNLAVAGQPRSVVVRSDRGYRQVLWQDFARTRDVTVEPWGRIEGVLRSGKDPLPGKTVVLMRFGTGDDWDRWHVNHDAIARTDAAGRFTFPRVAPGDTWVGLRSQTRSPGDAARVSRTTYAGVQPGQTRTVQIGGSGAVVTGSIVADGPGGPLNFQGSLMQENYKGMVVPSDWDGLTPQQREERWARWRDAGGATAAERQPFDVAFDVSADGSFRVEDVPAGRYWVNVYANSPPANGLSELIAAGSTELTVPSNPPAEPIRLPPLRANRVPHLSPGDSFPSMPLADADGKGHSLSQFAGKYVLVRVRVDAGQDPAGGAEWAEIFDCFGPNPRFAMVDVLAAPATQPSPAAQASKARWPQWRLAPPDRQLPPEIANTGVPTFLLDPAGNLTAKNLSPALAFAAISDALPRPEGQPGVSVVTEYLPPGKADASFPLSEVPRPSADDLARRATFHVVRSEPGALGRLESLNDGKLPSNDNDPPANFYFERGLSGRLRVELARQAAVEQINSYSWHKDTRAPQVYRVWGSDGTVPGFNPDPPAGVDPATCGWRPIASVDTRRDAASAPGGQHAVSIRARGAGPIGHFRHLLFQTFVTETHDGWGHTFYSELDVVGRED